MSRNSVLVEVTVRTFAVIQEEIRFTAFWKVMYTGVKVSRMEAKEQLSFICVEVMA